MPFFSARSRAVCPTMSTAGNFHLRQLGINLASCTILERRKVVAYGICTSPVLYIFRRYDLKFSARKGWLSNSVRAFASRSNVERRKDVKSRTFLTPKSHGSFPLRQAPRPLFSRSSPSIISCIWRSCAASICSAVEPKEPTGKSGSFVANWNIYSLRSDCGRARDWGIREKLPNSPRPRCRY